MNYFTIIILAIGLSFDSFAVSVTSGLNLPRIRFFQAVKLASVLAVFQAIMPVLGWLVGSTFKSIIAPVDHWIAFGLLSLVGGKMIMESFTTSGDEKIKDPVSMPWL